jgi:hypothetical protein
MEPTIPVFDFANPWVAVIQLALVYFLPRLTGLVTDRLTASIWKIVTLGILTVVGSGLTWLLDIAVSNSWVTLDYTALINVLVNSALTFFLAQGVFTGIIKPLGQAQKDAANETVKFIGPDPKLVMQEAFEKADAARTDIAQREVAAKVEELIAEPKSTTYVTNTFAPSPDLVTAADPAQTAAEKRSAAAKKAAATRKANAAKK